MKKLNIISPKRNKKNQTMWEKFFPYYMGYSEAFAYEILASLSSNEHAAAVLDPWNGSGTTTYVATRLGFKAIGFDLNPVMVLAANARIISPHEIRYLAKAGRKIIQNVNVYGGMCDDEDPLFWWFSSNTAQILRAFERQIFIHFCPDIRDAGSKISRIGASLYVALFAACRDLTIPFRASNPTWMRRANSDENKIDMSELDISQLFSEKIAEIGMIIRNSGYNGSIPLADINYSVSIRDTATEEIAIDNIDYILTSPPYCTRIDYTAATKVELALLAPILDTTSFDLSRKMIGSTRVPLCDVTPSNDWGHTCIKLLNDIYYHPSKASRGYYHKTHLDYFKKINASLYKLSQCLKVGGVAIFVVQGSYYKDIFNDLPQIFTEMCANYNLMLFKREDFRSDLSISYINKYANKSARGRIESVLCFKKER